MNKKRESIQRRAADVFLLMEALISSPPDPVEDRRARTLQLNQPLRRRTVSQRLWAPQSTTKGLVQASERAQGQGERGMKGEIVQKIISIGKKLQLARKLIN